jgi:hypothetical protein
VCEMLKPNLSGYSSNRRLRMVDLPVPLGPLMTMARLRSTAEVSAALGSVGAML